MWSDFEKRQMPYRYNILYKYSLFIPERFSHLYSIADITPCPSHDDDLTNYLLFDFTHHWHCINEMHQILLEESNIASNNCTVTKEERLINDM